MLTRPPRRWSRLRQLASMMLCVAGCASGCSAIEPEPRRFEITLRAVERIWDHVVVIEDSTGLVQAIGDPIAERAFDGSIGAMESLEVGLHPADPRTLFVGWGTSICATSTTLAFSVIDPRHFRLDALPNATEDECLMPYRRVVRVTLQRPIDPRDITLHQSEDTDGFQND